MVPYCFDMLHNLRSIVAYIKDSQSYHFSAQAPKRNISLPVAIIIAIAVHVLIIFGIGFSMGKDPAAMMQNIGKGADRQHAAQ